jgi:hypothetical protein
MLRMRNFVTLKTSLEQTNSSTTPTTLKDKLKPLTFNAMIKINNLNNLLAVYSGNKQMQKQPALIAVTGKSGSGKTTIQNHLVSKGYIAVNFADRLKDTVSVLFGWDRELLEGATKQSRFWREEKDEFWSEKLKDKFPDGCTPRRVLQFFGTEVVRNNISLNFWCVCVEKKIVDLLKSGQGVVVGDLRFPEELELIKKLGGKVIGVERFPLSKEGASVHASEHSLSNDCCDFCIYNCGSLSDLYKLVDDILLC